MEEGQKKWAVVEQERRKEPEGEWKEGRRRKEGRWKGRQKQKNCIKINQMFAPICSLFAYTNEAGASVYSASKLAVEELPEYDVTIRGAISIARRVQDPLAGTCKD